MTFSPNTQLSDSVHDGPHVSRLRQVFDDTAVRITHTSTGYVLDAAGAAVDIDVFRDRSLKPDVVLLANRNSDPLDMSVSFLTCMGDFVSAMVSPSPPALAPRYRTALRSVRLTFFVTGVLFATWAARIPTIKTQLGLSNGELAVAFAGLNLGAVLGLQVGSVITSRFGSRGALRVTMPLFAVSLSGLLLATGLTGLTTAVFIFAVANSVADIAMNAHGVAIERGTRRALLSGVHAWHSLGMASGSLVGAAAEHGRLPIAGHFVGITVSVLVVTAVGTRSLLPSATDVVPGRTADIQVEQRRRTRWPIRLIVLGALAFCVALAEGAANDWAAVYLHDETGASTTIAAVGFGLFAGSMCLGRLAGDRLVGRFGPVRPFLAGTLVAGIGLGVALLLGGVTSGLVGLALFGFGISYTLPVTFSASGFVSELHPTRAIAAVSTLGYLGFFTGPPLIGFVAEGFGLSIALGVPVLVVLLAGIGARAVRPPD